MDDTIEDFVARKQIWLLAGRSLKACRQIQSIRRRPLGLMRWWIRRWANILHTLHGSRAQFDESLLDNAALLHALCSFLSADLRKLCSRLTLAFDAPVMAQAMTPSWEPLRPVLSHVQPMSQLSQLGGVRPLSATLQISRPLCCDCLDDMECFFFGAGSGALP